MELFIPSLLVLVLGAIVCFVFLPKWSPYTLGLLSFGLLFIGAVQHYYMFPYEYKLSVLQATAADYAPFIMIAAVVLGGLIATMLAFGANPPSVASVADSLPNVSMMGAPANNKGPNNNKGASFNLGGNNNRKNNVASSSFKSV
jgi:hypothetical protein